MKTKIFNLFSVDDLLKVTVIFSIGLFSGYLMSLYFDSESKEAKYIDPSYFVESQFVNSPTNSILSLPIVRIGSGIR
tara:strand:- start:1797 stop:2027 length:231 start_codon:yes stop_codon:yes gene_type:complete